MANIYQALVFVNIYKHKLIIHGLLYYTNINEYNQLT